MRLAVSFFILVLSFSLNVFAHGEEKPGPHGGHIKMPGGFHTELEMDPQQGAHIFLVDMNFENPTVKDSSIQARFKSGKTEIPFTCSVMGGNHFHCVPSKKLPASGQLLIKATREKFVGNEVAYDLPLKAFASTDAPAKTEDHSHH
ncbi:hypothetical protein [Bdellovibrio sp. NC01]|uniref:hypothetical protein n=1 Tax=Bdellovibrio sp. NC01 TaxID=2220073 RepID=UPI00115BED87|nr:hypothetical protein [Bdellovibrio sp. NC01]QDK38098.1 hypothetical protein DOE51_11115 [Bdellovibrio sp. NC01]